MRILAAFLLAAASQAAAEPAGRVITIGLASNFSSPSQTSVNPFNDKFRFGVQMAVAEHGPSLLEKGIEVRIEEYDYGTKSRGTIEAAQAAIGGGAHAVIGFNNSTEALLAAPYFQAAKIPMVTPTASANRLSQMGSYIHPVAFNNGVIAEHMVEFALRRRLKTAALVVAMDCAYCNDLAASFRDRYERRGGRVVGYAGILSADENLEEALRPIAAAKSGLIVVPNYELVSAKIIDALLRLGARSVFLGGDSWENADGAILLKLLAGRPFSGFYVTDWHPEIPHPRSRRFVRSFRKEARREPDDDAVLGYDSAAILLKAILRSGTTQPQDIEESLNGLAAYDGVCGAYRLRANRAPIKPAAVVRVDSVAGRLRLESWIKPACPDGATQCHDLD